MGIGTLGLAAEWAWSHVWWTIPWTGALLPEGIIAGFIAAVAGGVIGGFIGGALQQRPAEPRWAPVAAGVAALALFAFALQMNGGSGTKAAITLSEASPPPGREVNMTVRLDPPDAADRAEWFNATAWQGGERGRPAGGGRPRHLPEHQAAPRLRQLEVHPAPPQGRDGGRAADLHARGSGDPGEGDPARDRVTRTFIRDKENLQREQKKGVSPVLTVGAYLIVFGIFAGLIASLAWGLRRFARREAPVKA